jgi:hypothetical protein
LASKGVRNSEPHLSRFIIFAWFFGILCCRVQIFWHLFTILESKAFRNHFSIWLVRGSGILNPLSRDLWFLDDFAEFYDAGFRFSDTFLQYWVLYKAFRNHFSIWLVRGSEILNPVSRDLSFLHDFAEFYVAGFRFFDRFLQYWGLKPSEITLVFGL